MNNLSLPPHIVSELMLALNESIGILAKCCEDCDSDGDFSFSRGRLSSIRNVIEDMRTAAAAEHAH